MSNTEENQALGDGVHRLVDMIVEEVSLVDRAANKHRFLIVKRDDTMDEDTTIDDAVDALASAAAEDEDDASTAVDSDTPLGAAVEALERLTEIVELLGALGESPVGASASDFASQLRIAAEALLARLDPTSGTIEAEDVEMRATKPAAASKCDASANTRDELTRAREAMATMKVRAARAGASKPKPANEPSVKKREVTPEVTAVTKGLESLSDSLKTLTELVREQQQRIGRVEKQFGLPSSAGAPEPVVTAATKSLGWPLDLNKPMDRENVDKAVSFHDL
jgi:hypothetical protein